MLLCLKLLQSIRLPFAKNSANDLTCLLSYIASLLLQSVLGQNGRGQNGTDKMVRTKWHR